MRKLLIPVFAASILLSCGDDTNKITAQNGEAVSNVSADEDFSPAERKKMEEAHKLKAKKQKELEDSWSSLEFSTELHDFGEVQAETDNFAEVIVTNTGNRPLIISNVTASCGCTMPKKPEGPIAPGKTDIIEVKFHSKPGQVGEVSKTVTVTANTEQKIHEFQIHAFVKE